MATVPAPLLSTSLLSATVTAMMAFFSFYAGFRVGNLRGKHAIKAPACSGHPEFDCAYRVHMNTLEQMGVILPLLWVANFYPIGWPWLAGLVWVVGRIL